MSEPVCSFTSLCRVKYEKDNTITLQREFDLIDGDLLEPDIDRTYPPFFDNRTWIYHFDGPDEEGTFGFWDWTATENYNDPDKDYIESYYNDRLTKNVVNIVDMGFESEKDTIDWIKKLPEIDYLTRRMIVIWRSDDRGFDGFYLDRTLNIDIQNYRIVIKKGINELPRIHVARTEIVSIGGKKIYSHMDVNKDEFDYVPLNDASEIVQNLLIERMGKYQGFTSESMMVVREIIKDANEGDFIDHIASATKQTRDKAKEAIELVLQNLKKISDTESLNHPFVESFVKNNLKIQKMIDDKVNREADIEIAARKESAEEFLASLENKKNAKIDEYDKINSEYEKLYEELAAIRSELEKSEDDYLKKSEEHKRKLDEEERSLQSKIDDLRNEYSIKLAKVKDRLEERLANGSDNQTDSTQEAESCAIYYRAGEVLEEADEYELETWRDAIDSIRDELSRAGVMKEYAGHLSALMYSMMINDVPMLAAGPNADNIANAFSAGIFGRKADILEIGDHLTEGQIAKLCSQRSSRVVVVKNAFSGNNLEKAISAVKMNPGNFYIFAKPMADDLKIEPAGLFNHMVPVMTELLIDAQQKNRFFGAIKGVDYKDKEPVDEITFKHSNGVLKKVKARSYAVELMETVLSDYRSIVDGDDVSYELLMVLFPYAFMTNQESSFLESESFYAMPKDVAEVIERFVGE